MTGSAPRVTLTHVHDDRVAVAWTRPNATPLTLFEYVYRPGGAAFEGPKPYLHPVRTLADEVVTTFRPHDHRWHKGIQMTIAHLSGQNFWGGNTYVHGTGYVPLPEVGRMDHVRWHHIGTDVDGALVRLEHDVDWITSTGERWVAERRRWDLDALDPEGGWWSLRFQTTLTNVRGTDLEIGSPTTHGRPMAGYGGLFWRGPRAFATPGATVIGPDGRSDADMMGHAARWLSFTGTHDGSDAVSTLLFINEPDSFRYPTEWFVRTADTPLVAFAPAFFSPHILAPTASIHLHHRIVIADGAWSRDRVEAFVGA